MLMERPFEEISAKDIAAKAGVGYSTFFRHYPDKEALLHHLSADEIRRLLGMTIPIFYTVDSLASLQATCAYVWEHRRLWTGLLTGGAAPILKEEYLRLAMKLIDEAATPKSWLPSDLAVRFSVNSSLDVLTWWLKQANPPSVKEMAEILNRLTVIPVMERASERGQLP